MRCLSVHLCVCLFVTFVDHVKTNKRILNFFSPSGSPTILVFLPNGMAIFRREPPNGGLECRWGRLKSRFSTNMALGSITAAPWFVFCTCFLFISGIRRPSVTRCTVTVVRDCVQQRETDQARSRAIRIHGRP